MAKENENLAKMQRLEKPVQVFIVCMRQEILLSNS